MTAGPFHTGAVARVHSLDSIAGFGVILARPPAKPTLQAALEAGAVSAIVRHDTEMTWPDECGQSLVRNILEAGGVAVLAFDNLRDAMACMLRLRKEGVI